MKPISGTQVIFFQVGRGGGKRAASLKRNKTIKICLAQRVLPSMTMSPAEGRGCVRHSDGMDGPVS
jgi:hypothetical protein